MKERGLVSTLIKHPVAANLIMILMIVSGLAALYKMNSQFFPDHDLNFVTVEVFRPNVSPEDMADTVTRPIENELRDLDFVKNLQSTSSLGISAIVIEFEEDTDMDSAFNDVEQKVSSVRNLPSDIEPPKISRIIDYEPVARLIVTSTQNDLETIRPWVRQFETELLEAGVAKINIEGMPEPEYNIEINPAFLYESNLPIQEIGRRIQESNQDISAGKSEGLLSQKSLRGVFQQKSVEGLQGLRIDFGRNSNQSLVRLGEVAQIKLEYQSPTTQLFYHDNVAVDLHLMRTGDANSLEMAAKVREWFEAKKAQLPEGLTIKLYEENWLLLQQRINLLLKNGAGGLVLILIILFLFLNGRVAFWVAMGIPVSFLATLAIAHQFGESINMISLFAMIMALGIIVDDAIVVAEDAMTHYNRGEPAYAAALGGATRMVGPVMSSSMTTIAAFLPLMMVSGIIGQFLVTIPFIVICVIMASLLESFWVLPGHLYHSFKAYEVKSHATENHHEKLKKSPLDGAFKKFRDNYFRPFIIQIIHHRYLTIAAAFVLFILAFSLVAFNVVKFVFFPSPEGTVIFANASFTAGTHANTVHEFAKHVQAAAIKADQELSQNNLIREVIVRKGSTYNVEPGGPKVGDEHASVFIELISPEERDIANRDFIHHWLQHISKPPALENLSISESLAGPPGKDIDVTISGLESLNVLKAASLELQHTLEKWDGISNIEDDMPFAEEDWLLELTETAKIHGFNETTIATQVSHAVSGIQIQVLNDKQETIDVRVKLPKELTAKQAFLSQIPILQPISGLVRPLGDLVRFKSKPGLNKIPREFGKPTIHVTAKIDSQLADGNSIRAELDEQILPALSRKYGVETAQKGRAEEQRDTLHDMLIGLIYAITFIYIILAWIFESYTWPLAVMTAIPLGLTGAIFGHWVMGLDLTLLSLFGLFGLSGIVVNDSIVLITFYKSLRKSGIPPYEAVIDASCQRLRAVMLTSMTTIAGLGPLLFERSLQAQFLIPMATSLSFGLAYGTVLVLMIVPSLLLIIEGFSEKKEENEALEPEVV